MRLRAAREGAFRRAEVSACGLGEVGRRGGEVTAPRARNVVLAQLAIIAVLLAAGEYVAGGAIDPLTDKVLQLSWPNPSNCLTRDAHRGMRYRPNCTGQTVDGTQFHTNELGLRDEPVRADGAIRILAVGDS